MQDRTRRRAPMVRAGLAIAALAGAVPEMNHNEVEAWRPPDARALHAVLLRDTGEPPAIAQRFALLSAGRLVAEGPRAEVAAVVVEGVATVIPFHRRVLRSAAFREGRVHTQMVEQGGFDG